MKKGTTKITVHNCITCTSGFHKGNQFPRPTCVKIEFNSYPGEDNWIQICEDCWEKLEKIARKQFNENRRLWAEFLAREIMKVEKNETK